MQLAGVTRRRRRQKCRRNGAAGLAKPRSVGPANPSPPCQTQQQPSEWEGGKRVSRICAKGASLRFAAVPTSSSAAHSPPTRVLQKAAQRTASTSPPLFCSFTRTLFALLRDGQPARTFRRKKSWALAREFERASSTTCRKTLPREERTQKTRARSSPGEATPYSSSPSEPNREEGRGPMKAQQRLSANPLPKRCYINRATAASSADALADWTTGGHAAEYRHLLFFYFNILRPRSVPECNDERREK